MGKIDTSIYKGFLRSLEKAMQEKYYVTLHFFRDPTIRGYITEIDKEVYVAIVESEEGNCSQIRLNQITSIMWKKVKNEESEPKINEEKTKNRKKNLAIMNENKEKMETETFTEYAIRREKEDKEKQQTENKEAFKEYKDKKEQIEVKTNEV